MKSIDINGVGVSALSEALLNNGFSETGQDWGVVGEMEWLVVYYRHKLGNANVHFSADLVEDNALSLSYDKRLAQEIEDIISNIRRKYSSL